MGFRGAPIGFRKAEIDSKGTRIGFRETPMGFRETPIDSTRTPIGFQEHYKRR